MSEHVHILIDYDTMYAQVTSDGMTHPIFIDRQAVEQRGGDALRDAALEWLRVLSAEALADNGDSPTCEPARHWTD